MLLWCVCVCAELCRMSCSLTVSVSVCLALVQDSRTRAKLKYSDQSASCKNLELIGILICYCMSAVYIRWLKTQSEP